MMMATSMEFNMFVPSPVLLFRLYSHLTSRGLLILCSRISPFSIQLVKNFFIYRLSSYYSILCPKIYRGTLGLLVPLKVVFFSLRWRTSGLYFCFTVNFFMSIKNFSDNPVCHFFLLFLIYYFNINFVSVAPDKFVIFIVPSLYEISHGTDFRIILRDVLRTVEKSTKMKSECSLKKNYKI